MDPSWDTGNVTLLFQTSAKDRRAVSNLSRCAPKIKDPIVTPKKVHGPDDRNFGLVKLWFDDVFFLLVGPQKVANWEGKPLRASGKSRLVKYVSIWPDGFG